MAAIDVEMPSTNSQPSLLSSQQSADMGFVEAIMARGRPDD
jgi:hypothetical protein